MRKDWYLVSGIRYIYSGTWNELLFDCHIIFEKQSSLSLVACDKYQCEKPQESGTNLGQIETTSILSPLHPLLSSKIA